MRIALQPLIVVFESPDFDPGFCFQAAGPGNRSVNGSLMLGSDENA
jgi:hypothetical protein